MSSYFRTRHASSVTNAITLTHNPNPFAIRFARLSSFDGALRIADLRSDASLLGRRL